MPDEPRLSTGIGGLDDLLGGGLIGGTLTVVVGATGAGKTQLGLQFANAGAAQEGKRGAIFDMTSRGDAQSHVHYAREIFGWRLMAADPLQAPDVDKVLDIQCAQADYLRIFDQQGRRVNRRDVEFEVWHEWQAEIARKLSIAIAFFYGNFVRGVRRAVIDGLEPTSAARESIQLELFEYVYHQILRKDSPWVARDLLRQHYRSRAEQVAALSYDTSRVACVLLKTSAESLLDDLIARPLDEGDVLAGANTVILLGRTRAGDRLNRALYVAKHRGSACSDRITPYSIDRHGLSVK